VIGCRALRSSSCEYPGAGVGATETGGSPWNSSAGMDGSIPYDPEGRLEPVSAGLGVKQDDKIERLKEVPLFEACSQRQLRSVAKIARVFDVAALAAEAPCRRLLVRAPPKWINPPKPRALEEVALTH
jgi:hypothetical protein